MSDTDNETLEAGETRCRHPGCRVVPKMILDSGWCFSHDPDLDEERTARARRGGEATARRNTKGLSERDLPPLRGPKSAARWAEQIGRAVAQGQLSHQQAKTTLQSVELFMKAFRSKDLDERLDKLTRSVAHLKRKRNGK